MLSAVRVKEIKKFLENLNIESSDYELFDEALTHPSFNFEVNRENGHDYERLEFLGDSVVRLCVSNFLFDRFKDYDEGKLTKIRSYLVSDEFLYKTALKLNLNEYINIGPNEEKDGGRKKESILACAMEAVFGAIYKDLGYSVVFDFIYNIYDNLGENLEEILYSYNSKEILQQYTQGKNKDLPDYEIIKESGKAHNRVYEVCVSYNGEKLGYGTGKTKKEAEKNAAFAAIKKLNITQGC